MLFDTEEFARNVFSATFLDRTNSARMHPGVARHIVGVAVDLNPTRRRRVVGLELGQGDSFQAAANPGRSSNWASPESDENGGGSVDFHSLLF